MFKVELSKQQMLVVLLLLLFFAFFFQGKSFILFLQKWSQIQDHVLSKHVGSTPEHTVGEQGTYLCTWVRI